MHDAVADFHFLLLVHERFAEIGIVSVATGRCCGRAPTNRKSFCRVRLRAVFAGGKNRRGRADGADRRHINMLVARAMSAPADPAFVLMKV